MSGSKTFLLGVGAQKCGTSWLHDYLGGHPSCDMGIVKEYHVLDALYVPHCADFLTRVVKRLGQPDRKPNIGDQERVDFCRDLNSYYDYFGGLLAQDGITVTGDLTPSYSMVPAAGMARIKAGLAERGVQTRVLFLMRDPFERIWSQVRMARREARNGRARQSMLQRTEAGQIAKSYDSLHNEARTKYDRTLRAMDQVFDRSEMLVGFYEEMFRPEFVRSVTDFLGIDYVTPDFGKQVNPSAKTDDLPQDLKATIAAHYAGTYNFVADRFGADRLAGIWEGYRLLS
ncbi:sulfotransferase [Paracoccus sp. M683]|uniref:sulfotransferase n=1 Tax=Paracoccus sp. M683 TaxID=2594268 RepID=UPI00117FC40E|nr:sulfotransferase [Paracoccus sp. M683]TRW98706.1 sulfotransferase [Paracoccus sp. M683]